MHSEPFSHLLFCTKSKDATRKKRKAELTTARPKGPLQLPLGIQPPIITHRLRDFIPEDLVHKISHVPFETCREDDYVGFEMRAVVEFETFGGVLRRERIGFDLDLYIVHT